MARDVTTFIDSANIYIEDYDWSSAGSLALLNVTASATGTYNSVDLVNTVHKGGCFEFNFINVSCTCTIRLMVQSKDNLSGNYITLASVSADGQSSGLNGVLFKMKIYPGVTNSGNTALDIVSNDVFTKTMRVQVSITATASVGVATGITMQCALTKVV